MKTAIYIRVSTTEQAKEGYSLAAQKRKLVGFCESRDWSIVEIYSDEGISGSSLKERPAAMRMIDDAKKGIFENILILKVDRLARNTRDLLEIVDLLKKYSVRLNAVDEQVDYTTPTGKMMLTMLGSFAELERSTIKERMMTGREQQVRSGIKVKTGKILFGYDYIDGKYIVNEEQAEIVKLIFDKILKLESFRAIARYLTNNKIVGHGGKKWTPLIIKRMVLNPTYMGYTFISLFRQESKAMKFENATIVKATNVEPIISEELYQQVYQLLTSRSSDKNRKYARSDFYFSDVVYCNNCGWKLLSRNAKGSKVQERRRYYRCIYNHHNFDEKCNFASIENSVLERLFLEYLEKTDIDINKAQEPIDKLSVEEDKILLVNLLANRDKIKSRKEKLLEKLLDGLIPDNEYTSTSNALIAELEDINNKIKAIEDKNKKSASISNTYTELRKELLASGQTIRELWFSLDDDQKRLLVTTLAKKIKVAKSTIVSIEFN